MVLEAVMICVDNSDYTRNGDYTPNRFECQTDAVNLVCGAKTRQNPENSVGILSTAGDRIEVMITPTQDLGRMISELPNICVGGAADLLRGIQTAQLALKHRQNKNQKQRVIAFVGSPIAATEKELETLGKNLKKNNVSLDLVSFGEVEENGPKLEKLINAVNSNDSSHVVEVPVGPKLLSDVLLSSVIVNPDGDAAGGGGGGGYEFGMNADEDPELALALRISMEEERARQAAASGDSAAADGGVAPPAAGGDAAVAPAAPPAAATPAAAPAGGEAPVAMDATMMEAMAGLDMEDMDDELRQALLLSMQDIPGGAAPDAEAAPGAAETPAAPAPTEAKSEAPMPTPPAAAAAAPSSGSAPAAGDGQVDSAWLSDPSFVQDLLGSLPGVDINDPRIQSVLKDIKDDDKKKDGESGGGDGSGSGDKQPPK